MKYQLSRSSRGFCLFIPRMHSRPHVYRSPADHSVCLIITSAPLHVEDLVLTVLADQSSFLVVQSDLGTDSRRCQRDWLILMTAFVSSRHPAPPDSTKHFVGLLAGPVSLRPSPCCYGFRHVSLVLRLGYLAQSSALHLTLHHK